MAQSPNIGSRRIIKKKAAAARAGNRGTKLRRQQSGTFQMKARRETILGPEALGATERACKSCFSVYFDKHWHSPAFFGGRSVVRRVMPAEDLCEACGLHAGKGRAASFVGEVVVRGKFSAEELAEMARLARNVGKRAQRRDPEDRIVAFDTVPGGFRVRTSENQLAISIGKQVHRARKGTELTITFSHGDKPVRVLLTR